MNKKKKNSSKTKKHLTESKKTLPYETAGLKDLLICTPYVKGYECGISEYEFLNNLYCDTQFDERINKLKREIDKLKENDYLTDEDHEGIRILEHRIDKINELKNSKIIFENNLLNNNRASARYICGNSGSGKSTYLGHLLLKHKAELKNDVYKIDLATSIRQISFLGGSWLNPSFKKTLGKFVSCLVSLLGEIISKRKDEDEKGYFNRIKKYTQTYNYIFSESVDYLEYFEIMEGFVANKYKNGRFAQRGDCFYTRFRAVVDENIFSKVQPNMDNIELINIINDLLDIIIVLTFFDAVTLKYIDGNVSGYSIDKKIIIAIDSLEHFIRDDEVFNRDIVDICQFVDVFINDKNELFEQLLAKDFSNIFKFIIAFRDTTAKMLPSRDAEDYDKCEVNLTEWFPPAFIFEKRKDYLKKAEVFKDNPIIKTIYSIMDDDIVNYGFFGKVLEMFNYNKRRMFQYIC